MNRLDMQALLAVGVSPEQLQEAAVCVELYNVEERARRRVACRISEALGKENPFSGWVSSSNSKPARTKKVPDLDELILGAVK